jgi:hypothetical protein
MNLPTLLIVVGLILVLVGVLGATVAGCVLALLGALWLLLD